MFRAHHPFRILLSLLQLAMILAAVPAFVGAADPETPPPDEAVLAAPEPPLAPESPFALAVRRSREAYDAELARLTELHRQATTPAQALDVQRRITALKQDAEVSVLEIQLAFAREAGRLELAAELEALIGQARAAMAAPSVDAAN